MDTKENKNVISLDEYRAKKLREKEKEETRELFMSIARNIRKKEFVSSTESCQKLAETNNK